MNRQQSQIIKRSFGILCARYNKKSSKLEFLLVQRRNSYGYIDFILRAQVSQSRFRDSKIMNLLNHMTEDEKLEIMSLDFGRMWYRIWLSCPGSPVDNTSVEELEKFKIYKKNFEERFLSDHGKKLIEMIRKSKTIDKLWEIPKGRKNNGQETNLVCAIREFEEETGINSNDYMILNDETFEIVIIDDNVKYIQTYFLAIYTGTDTIQRYKQSPEISEAAWLDIDQINIVSKNEKLIKAIRTANKIFRKKCRIQKLHELDMFPELI